MAVDNGSFIADMEVNIPANTDPRYEGAAQIRAVKRMVQDSFPNIDGAVTADVATLNYMTDGTQGRFIGETTMFQGLPENIPDGWVLSDGTIQNGYQTVDLRNKFIMGYNDTQSTSQPVRSTGGDNNPALSDFLTSEEHVLDLSQIPSHTHEMGGYRISDGNRSPDQGDEVPWGGTEGRTNTTAGEEVGGGQGHSHDLTDSATFDNRPEYVVLAYIVYVGKTV
ncbi:hypothetical protein CPT_Phriendly_052 [Vibrio phage Phriendly]|nr:hypothetical protein CPT_Phriendly_052 [Vibrio phage Phriendly]